MNKIVLGLLLGLVLGALDGATAWFTPEVRAQMAGIIIGGSFKSAVAGVACGLFARKVQSLFAGVLFGLAVGFLLALGIAYMQHAHYAQILVPGSLVGILLGFATQKYGRAAGTAASAG